MKWTSSNSKIVSVNSSGKVIAKSAGKATIKAVLNNGRYASCTVTVKPKTNKIKKLKKSEEIQLRLPGQKSVVRQNNQIYMSTKKKIRI